MSDAIKMLDAAIQDVDSDIRSDMQDAEETGENVEAGRYEVVLMYYEAQAIRATVIEQQAEIERLREALQTIVDAEPPSDIWTGHYGIMAIRLHAKHALGATQ